MRARIRKPITLPCVLIMASVCLPSWAADRSWMRETPMGRMTKEDLSMANATRDRALDEGTKGQVYKWANPQTGASGAITPLTDSFARKESDTCRRAKFDIAAGGQKNTSTWTVCKVAEGWKVVQ